MVAIALVAVALGVVLFVAARRRGRGRALTTVGALAVLAVGATAWGLASPGSASAATDCGPGGGSHAVLPVPSATPTDQSTDTPSDTAPGTPSGTRSDSPTDTPDDTPSDTPSDDPAATPAARYAVSGTYTMDGWTIEVTTPPGVYWTRPTQYGGADWSLPTVVPSVGPVAGATVTLLSGSDVVATTTTDTSGNYLFTVEPGDYTVAVSTLPSAGSGVWRWWTDVTPVNGGIVNSVDTFDGTWTTPAAATVAVTDSAVTGVDFATTNPGLTAVGSAVEPPPVRG